MLIFFWFWYFLTLILIWLCFDFWILNISKDWIFMIMLILFLNSKPIYYLITFVYILIYFPHDGIFIIFIHLVILWNAGQRPNYFIFIFISIEYSFEYVIDLIISFGAWFNLLLLLFLYLFLYWTKFGFFICDWF